MAEKSSTPLSERERVLAGFTAFSSAQTELVRLFARSMNLHSTDATAVVQIIEHEDRGRPLTPARLAERIGLSPGATSILLSRLETAGFVERTRERSDRRIVTLRSTKTINDAADAFFEPLEQQLYRALASFSPAEIAVLGRAADHLTEVVGAYVRAAAADSGQAAPSAVKNPQNGEILGV